MIRCILLTIVKKMYLSIPGKYAAGQHTKFIPRDLPSFQVDVGVFGKRAPISSIGGKDYFTVSIESKEVAQAFRTIFEVMWRAAKE